MNQTITKGSKLKEAILSKYKSVRSFAIEMEIPYSTLATALDRGIEGMAYGTVIRMCDKLGVNPIDFTPLDHKTDISSQMLENKVMAYYLQLNSNGREKIMSSMEDYLEIPRYRA